MNRVLALSAVVLLALASTATAAPTSLTVDAKLNDGNVVTATCNISQTGQFTGAGVLSGKNAATGTTYSYPFTITKGSTAGGKLTLAGKLAGLYDVTLSTTVPNGAVVFSYVVNGKTYSFPGQGAVTVK